MIVIDAKHFYAAVVLTEGIVTRAAPIIRYMIGWDRQRVLDYAKIKKWKTADVELRSTN